MNYFSLVDFGAAKTALATVGYRLFDADGTPNGARVVVGVAGERFPGAYAALISLDPVWLGEIRWDTGEVLPIYLADVINGRPQVNVTAINGATVNGTGVTGDKWRGA